MGDRKSETKENFRAQLFSLNKCGLDLAALTRDLHFKLKKTIVDFYRYIANVIVLQVLTDY